MDSWMDFRNACVVPIIEIKLFFEAKDDLLVIFEKCLLFRNSKQ